MQTQQIISSPFLSPRYFRNKPLPAVTLPALLAVATLLAVLFMAPRTMADPDIWWHLRNARELITTHHFLDHDLYSFTAAGAPWLNHEWLAELPFYLGWLAAGPKGVIFVTILAIELIFAGVLILTFRACRNMALAAVLTFVAAVLSTVSFGPRTLLFGWLCLIAELLILELCECRPRLVFALPILFALWINLHGSWIIGLILLAVHLTCTSVRFSRGAIVASLPPTRPLWLASALSLPALLLNPYTWRLIAYPFNLAYAQKLNIANVQEWQSLDWHSPRGRLFFATLAILALRQIWRARTWTLRELAYLLIATYSAVTYSRFLFLFAILAAPIVARAFRRQASAKSTSRPLLNALCLAALLAITVQQFQKPHPDRAMQAFPLHPLPTLHGPIFNEFLWGGYLIWTQPQVPVFIDSRVDLFEANGTFRDYLDMIRVHNTLALLAQHHIRYVFFEPDTPLIYLLQQTGSWHTLYQDQTAILLERNQP